MNCKICGTSGVEIVFHGPLRDGAFGQQSVREYDVYQCPACGVFWHDIFEEPGFYESVEYRQKLEGSSEIEDYYRLHDHEVLPKLQYTGTDIFRGRVVADIGCAGGNFLDYVSGVAKAVIGVEPSAYYRSQLEKKGYRSFPYQGDLLQACAGQIGVLTSFDVIEHVPDPAVFVAEQYQLLETGGVVFCGTPSAMPALRHLLPAIYEPFLFSVQHPWGLSEKALRLMFEQAGFEDISVTPVQRYSLSNALSWLTGHRPMGEAPVATVGAAADGAWRAEVCRLGYPDYFVVKATR